MPDLDTVLAASATSVRFLTFQVAGRHYALRAEDVAEVIRIPPMARVPHSPKSLLGIANLRGVVLPVASLRGLLDKPENRETPNSRAIVLDVGARVAVAVDEVESIAEIAAESINVRQAELGAEPGEHVAGVFQTGIDGTIFKILNIRQMLDTAFANRTIERQPTTISNSSAKTAQITKKEEATEQLVTFEIAGQEFALALKAVQEILPSPATKTALPQADTVVIGVSSLRGKLLPLLSLRGLLGFPLSSAGSSREKVIVMMVAGAEVGLVVDRARAIVNATAGLIDAIPPVLAARNNGESRIRAIYRGDAGRRLISILALEQLFREDVMKRLIAHGGQQSQQPVLANQLQEATLCFLVFRLGDDEFALPIDTVDEVAQVPLQITRVPKTPKFLEGVVNLRGAVLPVVDQRHRFDMPKRQSTKGSRLLVVRTERHRAGLIVDGVSDVLRVSPEAIEPAPDLTEGIARLIRGVINLELKRTRRIVLLLDPLELLTSAERGLLDKFKAKTAKANE